MNSVISHDGTAIAFERSGTGPAVILVGGTLDRHANSQLAALLAPYYTVFHYFRRGHGASGNTAPWAFERECEDLQAIIAAAGSAACVYGSSTNGVFALEAAARGLALTITKLAVWEPPYIVDDSRPPLPADYRAQLTTLLAAGRRFDMVELFFTHVVGMPAETVAAMRQMPFFAGVAATAHTLIHDAAIVGDMSVPTARMAAVTTPTLVLNGGEAEWLWIQHGLRQLTAALPRSQRYTLEGQPHNVDQVELAPVLHAFFASRGSTV